MTKVKLNPVFMEFNGQMGDLVFRRTRRGGLSLIRKADMSKVKWSPAQQASRQRFRLAVAYAKEALADPQRRPHFEELAVKTGQRPSEAAIAEYLRSQHE